MHVENKSTGQNIKRAVGATCTVVLLLSYSVITWSFRGKGIYCRGVFGNNILDKQITNLHLSVVNKLPLLWSRFVIG